jgi:rhodanese-related sulfurtransferase
MSTRPDRLSPEIAAEMLAEGRALFLDARPLDAWQRRGIRIPGALHVDPGSGAAMDELLRSLPRERVLVAYCDSPGQAESAQVARRLRELGMGDASVLEGGLKAWEEEGRPIEPIPEAATRAT